MPEVLRCAAGNGIRIISLARLRPTECQLVRMAGPTQEVAIGANERGERTAAITYPQGEHAGIYRFTAGLLTTIDRAPEPARPQRRPQRR